MKSAKIAKSVIVISIITSYGELAVKKATYLQLLWSFYIVIT